MKKAIISHALIMLNTVETKLQRTRRHLLDHLQLSFLSGTPEHHQSYSCIVIVSINSYIRFKNIFFCILQDLLLSDILYLMNNTTLRIVHNFLAQFFDCCRG